MEHTAVPFEVKTVVKKKSQETLLKDAVKILEEHKDHKIAQRLAKYIEDRNSYINNHMGKYVTILENGSLAVVEEADINASFRDVPGERHGIVMKIGEEVKDSRATGLYANSFPNTSKYTIPITFMAPGMPQTRRYTAETIVDTGCEITTFSTTVLDFIELHGVYSTAFGTVHAVGGQISVRRGIATVEFCGRVYENMLVQFSDIPCVALIGMDLLNKGKLDVDCGQRLSFTHH